MRDVVLIMTASIDGYVVAPEGHSGGVPEPEELQRWKLDRIRRAGTHIMGRVTYEEMASFWPTSSEAYAPPMNDIPKVVFSTSLTEAPWPDSTIATGPLTEEIAALKQQAGGEIIAWGGARFVQSLSAADLIDTYAIVTQPVAYGGGEPIFRDLPGVRFFTGIASTTYPGGTRLDVYRRAG